MRVFKDLDCVNIAYLKKDKKEAERSMGDKNRDDYYHDKGQRDGAGGKYNPPPNVLPMTDRDVRDSRLYDKGYKHGDSQRKK